MDGSSSTTRTCALLISTAPVPLTCLQHDAEAPIVQPHVARRPFMTVVTRLRATGCGYTRLGVPSCARLEQKETIYDNRHIRRPSVHTRGVEPSLDRTCGALGRYVNSKGYIRI